MKRLFLLVLFGSGSVLADLACTTGSLSTYTVSSFSCTLDQFTFKEFVFAVTATSGGPTAIGASSITVTPSVTSNPSGRLLSLAFSSAGFSVSAGQSITYEIRFNVDPQPDIIIEADDILNSNTPVAPGAADIITNLCVGGQWTGIIPSCSAPGVISTLNVFHHGTPTGNQLTDSVTFAPVHLLGYDDYITLNGGAAGGGGSSSITGITNSTLVTPEPASLGLCLTGVALLALRRLLAKYA